MTMTSGPNLATMVDGASGDSYYTEFVKFLRQHDGFVMAHAKSATTVAQPASPIDGDVYIIPTGATGGSWAGNAGKVARFSSIVGISWELYTPKKGWEIAVEDQTDANGMPNVLMFNGTIWGYPSQALGAITGLKMVWNSATSISVMSGSAVRPSDGMLISLAATVTKASLSLTASTWYHIYLYMNGTTPDIEIVTTAPAAPYNGTARAKTGDTLRRYIGSVRTDASSNVYNFKADKGGTQITYMSDARTSPFRVLANGLSVTWTAISVSAFLPVTSTQASVVLQNISTGGSSFEYSPDSAGTGFKYGINPAGFAAVDVQTSTAQIIYYQMTASQTQGGYMDLAGYYYER